ncbi:MAG: response regulator [Clostridia bacterium]|nr:response regulator [Clostridia bacterium]
MENYEELKKHVNILLVDDDLDYIQVTAFFLKTKGYNVDIATSGSDAINKVSNGNFHIILLDYYMPELTGEDVVNKIREFNDRVIIIFQTGFAGQQPPEETLKRLNIQNYHDKSDGVEKLLLQVTAAVRIFNQQNLIELSRYRINAMGKLVKGIAEELKTPLLSIGASMEATKMLVESIKSDTGDEAYGKLNAAYLNSKSQIERIDKICKTIINQTDEGSAKVGLTVRDIVETLKLMTANEMRSKCVTFEENITLRPDSYVYGAIDDVIFILCEIVHKLVEKSENADKILLNMRENDTAWYISLSSDKSYLLNKTQIYLIKNITGRIADVGFEEVANQYVIEIKKNKGE